MKNRIIKTQLISSSNKLNLIKAKRLVIEVLFKKEKLTKIKETCISIRTQ